MTSKGVSKVSTFLECIIIFLFILVIIISLFNVTNFNGEDFHKEEYVVKYQDTLWSIGKKCVGEKVDIRERYLKGDFSKEKQEIDAKYSLNNISTGTQFELYLTEIFKKLGYKTIHNGKAGDQGADLILKKGDYIYAVQAKFYTDKLSNTPIQEIVGALKYYNANQGVVVTNSTFTKGAQDLAKANNVILIDGNDLKKLVDYIFNENIEDDILQEFIN